MSRDPVVITLVVPFHDVDESFGWWMHQYERDPDGQFLEVARQLKPSVTTATYFVFQPQFEHPKGEVDFIISFGDRAPDPQTICLQHSRPVALGYCDRFRRADGRPLEVEP